MSPGGQTAATISEIRSETPARYYVHVWDTRSWRLLSTTGPFNWGVWGEEILNSSGSLMINSQ